LTRRPNRYSIIIGKQKDHIMKTYIRTKTCKFKYGKPEFAKDYTFQGVLSKNRLGVKDIKGKVMHSINSVKELK